jgi:glycosyltransferase A (GT-A) superfamily protein (DUF2064 family)
MIEDVLVLVCKRPGLGKGKQRLAAGLGPDAANRIAEAMLACALEDARAWPCSVMIAPANRDDYSWAENLLPEAGSKVRVQPQADGNLGQRLNTLDHTLRNAGLERLFYIGSDAPALGAEDYAAAREALVNHDTVLVPSSDGGVVLMASRKPWPELNGLPWSTASLGLLLEAACRAAGHSLALLSPSFDVDEEADAIRLITALRQDPRPRRRALLKLVSHLVQFRGAGHASV